MNNYEFIKTMDLDTLADFISDITNCMNCPATVEGWGCSCYCKDQIKEWLEMEEW